MVQATDSQIAMWRGAIALAWVNGGMNADEKQQLLEYFKDSVCLTDEQRALLTKDLDQKFELKDVWGAITDTQDRAHLIDIAPTLFAKPGAPTPQERALYDKMIADQMATVDKKELQQQAWDLKNQVAIDKAAQQSEYEKDFNNLGAVGRMIFHLDIFFEKLED